MLIRRVQLLAIVAAVGLTVSCLGPKRTDYVTARQVSVAHQSEDADQLWTAIQETLRRNRFRLDRVDRRTGVISTMPTASQHFFEFWRHDVDTREDFWEATLNPMRRWAEVSVTCGPDNTWQELAVVVHKERLSSPDRQFNSTGAAYEYFGDDLPSTTGPVEVTAEDDRWLDLGRDPAMEDYLLRAIFERARIEGVGQVIGDAPK